jgi:hypothetical protein
VVPAVALAGRAVSRIRRDAFYDHNDTDERTRWPWTYRLPDRHGVGLHEIQAQVKAQEASLVDQVR